jgi:hypothetical protein
MRDDGGEMGGEDQQPGRGRVAGQRLGWPPVRHRSLLLGVVLVVVAAGVGAFVAVMATRDGTSTYSTSTGSAGTSSTGTWFKPSSLKLSVSVAAGCPGSDVGYADVVNTFPGPLLVPADPSAGLVCRYGPGVSLGANGSGRELLVSSTRLDNAQAQQLASVIRRIDLAAPSGTFSCPLDVGAAATVGFSYPDRVDVGLWYRTSGCQTLDNGRIGAFEGANPSFYDAFETVINRLSPPADTG